MLSVPTGNIVNIMAEILLCKVCLWKMMMSPAGGNFGNEKLLTKIPYLS